MYIDPGSWSRAAVSALAPRLAPFLLFFLPDATNRDRRPATNTANKRALLDECAIACVGDCVLDCVCLQNKFYSRNLNEFANCRFIFCNEIDFYRMHITYIYYAIDER